MNICVFDTETAGCHTQTLLNVGYMIADYNPAAHTLKPICQRDYIVRSVLKNRLFMLNDMFVGAEKMAQLQGNVDSGGATLRSLNQIFAQMKADLTRHKVVSAYAYNSAFDTDKFARSAVEYGLENPLDGVPVFDLWGMAFEFICKTDDYKAFCQEHNLLTESKRFWKTSVEGVTAFLNDDPSFTEEHTALSDVQWESKIFVECMKRGANMFQEYEHGFLPSGYVFKKTLMVDGKPITIAYTKMSRKWDSADLITFEGEVQ